MARRAERPGEVNEREEVAKTWVRTEHHTHIRKIPSSPHPRRDGTGRHLGSGIAAYGRYYMNLNYDLPSFNIRGGAEAVAPHQVTGSSRTP
ncbi:hypothetical protein GCM10010177_73730 [Actinomadura citrea]|nr:hypothetical protein GCM10010177_73730 [Actinomadura citrea]